MAEYLAHMKPMTDASDDWFTSFSSSYSTPLLLFSLVLSSIAVIFTVMLIVKLRTLYILCMGVKSTTAVQIPTYFDFLNSNNSNNITYSVAARNCTFWNV